MKKLISLLMIFLFLGGLLPVNFQNFSAVAKTKKAIYKKIYRKSIKAKKVHLKRKRPISKAKKKIFKKRVKKFTKISRKMLRKFPRLRTTKAGTVTQTYSLEEGFDELEADRIADALKTLGVESVSTNVENNSVTVKFKTNKLSSIRIIQKLKQLGYTIKRIG